MKIVPVIDLLQGQVVHARRGERHAYRPIESSICASSQPLAVVDALLRLGAFDTLYVADLDAILGHGNSRATLESIQHAFPQLALWVDAGLRDTALIASWPGPGAPVVGSESLPEAEPCDLSGARCAALSLDFRQERLVGPASLADPAAWPERVLVMTLDRVGSGLGPDVELLSRLALGAGGREIYAAGGVRDATDLEAAARAGAAGALVATALHDGRLSAADLARFR